MTPATDHPDEVGESARLLRSGPLSHTGLVVAINAQIVAMIQTDPFKVVNILRASQGAKYSIDLQLLRPPESIQCSQYQSRHVHVTRRESRATVA